jgi:hypothetical protein
MAVHVTTLFEKLGQATAKGLGVPNLGIALMPHPLEGRSPDEIRKQAEGAIDSIVEILTHVPAEFEGQEKLEEAKLIKIAGEDYADAYEQFNQLFLEKRWGDGLPLVPPTKEKVDWMLTGTDLSPEEVVVEVRPSGRPATVRQIAVNAVMAGAIPAYMPVIIAVLRAFDEIPWGWSSVETTSAVAPMIVINGPIAKQLDINSKSNAMGYGWRANTAIGRTIEMIFHCVGGAIPGFSDMSTLGHSHTITSLCFAENQDVLDDIGWPSYAEERGFDRKTSTVSVTICMAGYKIVMPYGQLGSPEDFMEGLVWTAAPINLAGWPNANNPHKELIPQMGTWVLTPENARCFGRAGWK